MKKILSALLAMALMLSVTAFAGTSAAAVGGAEPAPGSASPVGVYKLTGLDSGSGTNLAIVSSIVNMGVDLCLILREDGTGSMAFLEAEIPLEWDGDSILLRSGKGNAFPGPVRVPYTCENGVLTITTLAYSMEFGAMSEEERAGFETNGSGSLAGLAGRVVQGLIGRMDGGLVEGMLFDLALGMMSEESEPIPEGEPSRGSVAGMVDGVEFTLLGADCVPYEGNDYIVFFFDAVNRSDGLEAVWTYELEAMQDGEFLEPSWDLDSVVPESFNVNYSIYPGRTIRCAAVFTFDPNGGTVGFRIHAFRDDATLLYYADPGDLSGVPAEPFAFDADPSVPPELEKLPRESEHVRIEGAELFAAEGGEAVRFLYRYVGLTEDEAFGYHCVPLQDGIEVRRIWEDAASDGKEDSEEDPGRLRTYSCLLRTGSPVVLVVYEEKKDGADTPVAAWIENVR